MEPLRVVRRVSYGLGDRTQTRHRSRHVNSGRSQRLSGGSDTRGLVCTICSVPVV